MEACSRFAASEAAFDPVFNLHGSCVNCNPVPWQVETPPAKEQCEEDTGNAKLRDEGSSLVPRVRAHNVGAFKIAYTILGAPYYTYSILLPQNPILIMKAPTLKALRLRDIFRSKDRDCFLHPRCKMCQALRPQVKTARNPANLHGLNGSEALRKPERKQPAKTKAPEQTVTLGPWGFRVSRSLGSQLSVFGILLGFPHTVKVLKERRLKKMLLSL